MKDRELRMVLCKAGIVTKERDGEGCEYLSHRSLGIKVDAIISFLGIEFKRIPEKVIAQGKVAPQNTIEAANTSTNISMVGEAPQIGETPTSPC